MYSFILFGNGSSGTTILQKCLNSHPSIVCEFEYTKESFEDSFKYYQAKKDKYSSIGISYGNKLVFEQTLDNWPNFNCWTRDQFLELFYSFKPIFIFREFSSWKDSWIRRQNENPFVNKDYENRWSLGWDVATDVLRITGRALFIDYHDFCERTESVLKNIYDYIGVGYDDSWKELGVGHNCYGSHKTNKW